MTTIRRLVHWIEKALIGVAIAAAIATPLALHYLPVPVDWKNEAVPAGVALGFLVVLRLLFAIDKKLETTQTYREYPTMTDAIPHMIRILEERLRRGHTVKVFASSGGTTINVLLPRIQEVAQKQPTDFNLQIKLIDPASPLAQFMPPHWAEEARLSILRLQALRPNRLTVRISQYPYLPCLGGVLVDDNHLFLGFYVWEGNQQTRLLQGAEQPHFYFRRGSRTEYAFRVWESWFDLGPESQATQGPRVHSGLPPTAVQRTPEKPKALANSKKLIVAHRGVVSPGVRENTIAAFRNAIELGADMIEFDVRRTSDGVLVCSHDEAIEGLPVGESSYAHLRDEASKAGYELATLPEVLKAIGNRIMLDVELKETGYEEDVLKLLGTLNSDRVRITSFHAGSIRAMKKSHPDLGMGLLVEKITKDEIFKRYTDSSADFLAPHYDLLDAAAETADGLFVWTVDDYDKIHVLCHHPKVAGIITNRTKIAIECRDSKP